MVEMAISLIVGFAVIAGFAVSVRERISRRRR
jgi:hypothetical protein